jgi:hypothetical protein
MGEKTVDESGTHLCLVPCPRCRAAKFSGGACHLSSGHAGAHECSVVSGEIHRWMPAACAGWGRGQAAGIP